MSSQFSHLKATGRIGRMQLKNRMCMTAMGTSLMEEDGSIGDRAHAYYTERAKGGASLITMGSASIAYPVGATSSTQLALSDDKYIPGLKRLADSVHEYGCKLALQLHFAGLNANLDRLEGRPLCCPSTPKPPTAGDMVDGFIEEELKQQMELYANMPTVTYNEMSADDIQAMVQKYADAAVRAQKAGLDGVEIHGAHGYILSSFISPYTNRRSDDYGGSLENRLRFLLEVIAAVRAAVGNDMAIWCKIDSKEYLKDQGISLEDAKKTAKLIEQAGVDAITVSAYHDTNWGAGHSASHTPAKDDNLVDNAAAIKSVVAIPVITSGKIEPSHAEKFIAQGKFDFFGMGRKLLADPHLPNKIIEGRSADILPCIYCFTCISQIYNYGSLRCAVNPETGFEQTLKVVPSSSSKHVVVVGGGPGGMEAARRFSLKGYKVTLLEQADTLGGTARFASIAFKGNERLIVWLKRQLKHSSVDVRLNTKATPALLKALAPDEVVVATGAARDMPDIPGNHLNHVFSGDDMRGLVLGQNLDTLTEKTHPITRLLMKISATFKFTHSLELLRQASKVWMPLGKHVTIIGGELVALELAEYLAHRGRIVTVLDDVARFGKGLPLVRRWRVLAEVREAGVVMLPQSQDIAIDEECVQYTNPNGQRRSIRADHVIVAKGAAGDLTLANALDNAGFSVHSIGDCTGIGYIDGAMSGAARLAVDV